ncbi:hypothetical protein AB0907_24120 [Streptomyces sp. NPDC006975]|uniref:hypothetical protein n=1 Tax=Streptomyces sp. NPDC006975 TaxID=3154310 RepID=UPI0034566DCD
MNYRPYPSAARALAQVKRGRIPEAEPCRVCGHRVDRHAIEDGERVCTRGAGLISCRDCAELWARMPASAALLEFGRVFRFGSRPQVLTEHPRRTGKTAITAALTDQAVTAGAHVHVAGRDGVRCAGGDLALPLPGIGCGDQVLIEYNGRRARYEVTDIPSRARPGRLILTLRAVGDSEVTGE